MKYVHATIIVATVVAANLRKLSQMLDRLETDGMFTTELSTTGNLPATHYIIQPCIVESSSRESLCRRGG